MAFTHKLSYAYSSEGSVVTNTAVTQTADSQAGYDGSIPTGTTDQEVDISFLHTSTTALKMFLLSSDQNVQIETNATDASGGNTVQVLAGTPQVYFTGGPFTNPFTHDVLKMYITNTSGSTANISIRALYDGTP